MALMMQICKNNLQIQYILQQFSIQIQIMNSRISQIRLTVEKHHPEDFAKEDDNSIPKKILDLIEWTRQEVANLSEAQKYERARIHLEQALQYKNPRVDIFETCLPLLFRICYSIQSNSIWNNFMRLLSFIYMYLIAFDKTNMSWVYIYLSPALLILMWADFFMEIYHTSFDKFRKSSKFTTITSLKGAVLILLIIELILIQFEVAIGGRPFNPLRFIRATLPILYVPEIQRSFQALLSALQQLIVFAIFYSIVIIAFAIGFSIILKLPAGTLYDEYTSNYNSFEHMLFITYVNSSYDAYPDNQLLAVAQSYWYYGIIIVFVFLNMFLYTSIPGSQLFDAYINYRGKFMLIDEIKMQHSLILAFVSLGQVNYEIDIRKVIDFLLYWYDYRTRYLDAITQIALKLNSDGNCSIHVLEFMQLGRILQQNSNLKPPLFKDIKRWTNFRKWILANTGLKKFAASKLFQLIVGLIILGSFINGLICLYSPQQQNIIIDQVISYIFVLEIIIKIVGEGPQNFYNRSWNMLDLFLIMTSLTFSLISSHYIYSSVVKLFRIFRSIDLLNLVQSKQNLSSQNIFVKLTKLYRTIVIILPLLFRFLPLYCIAYYTLGVIGMEIFYDAAQMSPTDYDSVYNEYSNFKSFIYTQFYFMQILTEAGWSAVAFDHAKRLQNYFFGVMIFFIICHMVIVLVLASLLKGIVWSVYETVSNQFEEHQKQQQSKKQIKNLLNQKVNQFNDLKQILQSQVILCYDTILKRQCYESNANSQIIKQISRNRSKYLINKPEERIINMKLHKHFKENKILMERERRNGNLEAIESNFLFTLVQKFIKERSYMPLEDIEELEEEDIQIQINQIAQKFKLKNHKLPFQITRSETLFNHLKSKFYAPYAVSKNQDSKLQQSKKIMNKSFNNPKKLQFHTHTLHILLNMKTSRRQQKKLVLDSLVYSQVIDEAEMHKLLIQKGKDRQFYIDQDCTVRKMYLSDTNKNLIQKFQAEYFGDIYGNAFKEVNKITIEPLIRVEAGITSALKKLMRFPQISSAQFFKILARIEDQISNSLLKRGSICKFVFQLYSNQQIWFAIDSDKLNQNKLCFLKHGHWIYHQLLQENQIYYAKDLFKTGKSLEKIDLEQKAIIMKKLYETFETLGFALGQCQNFFESNPTYHVYDTYLNYIDVRKMERLVKKQFEVCKIMVVLLTKQQPRKQNKLEYPISDIQIQKPIDNIDFMFGETQTQTYQKLSNLCALNDDEITANQGMPFAYVLNFLCQINDILKLYAPNFVHQIQNVLNKQIHKVQANHVVEDIA